MTALSVLGVGAPTVTGAWLLTECVALWVFRGLSEGTYRFQMPGMDGLPASLACHLFIYIGVLGAPVPFLRFPGKSSRIQYPSWYSLS